MTGLYTHRKVGGAPTNNNGTSKPTPAIFCASTLTPAQVSVPTPTLALDLLGRYMDKNLQKATKLALELFVKGQEYGQLKANFTF